jgi:hypothetical protein
MKIGLLSDTHGYLDPAVRDHFLSCDEVWHAGDIGSMSLLEELRAYKPLRAVFGNIDSREIQLQTQEDLIITREGLTILITHIGGSPPAYNTRVKKLLLQHQPDVLVCGHSHILKVGRDETQKGMLFLNPGAAGHHGLHHIRTLLRFELSARKVQHMEVIELGKQGKV